MTTIDKVADIIGIILIIIYIIVLIIVLLINLKNLYEPKKYYKVEYIYDNNGKSKTVIKARTPKQAIRKLLRKHSHYYPLSEITDVISCTEVDYFKCLKEVEEDE